MNELDEFFEDIDPATKQIYDYIQASLGRRESDSRYINRASSASQCPRKLWYKSNGHEGDTLDSRAIINFALGDLTEAVVKSFIKLACVGTDKLYSEVDFGEKTGECYVQGKHFEIHKQKDLITTIYGMTITGHADGFGKRNSDGKWELIEIKSAADYGFQEFIKTGPGDYIKQSHCLMMSEECQRLEIKDVRFFYLKKNTGHVASRLYSIDAQTITDVTACFLAANGKTIPFRPYEPIAETFRTKPTGKYKLPWQCSYCPYTATCWPQAKMELKAGKPIYYLTEETKDDRNNGTVA